MNTFPRVLGFTVACAALFAGALGVGRLVGPVASEPADAGHDAMSDHGEEMGSGHDVGGLEASAGGYTLNLADTQPGEGRQRVAFSIIGPDGRPVTAYDEQHERALHLVVVRRDLAGFQHVHPVLDAGTGEWGTDAYLAPGAWRVLADFVPAGGAHQVLGTDLLVPGAFAPEPLGADSAHAAVDGYDVTLSRADAGSGESVLTATVSKGGAPVTDLEPYLGAYGHLVALRDGDLGYLHVHPEEGEPGPEVVFGTTFPSGGRYRLFLDFQHDGVVHTAAFTVTVDG